MKPTSISAITLLAIAIATHAIAQEPFGRFDGSPKVEFVDKGPGKGRDMRLLKDFTYTDSGGSQWTAQKGYQTDGASIPPVFWSIVGGPFEGDYRKAAVIHDWYCHQKNRPWQDVHRIFYYGSRAEGVGEIKSKILYAAVMFGGPRWGKEKSQCYASCQHPSFSLPQNFPTGRGENARGARLSVPSFHENERTVR
jgi:hypothetical protein